MPEQQRDINKVSPWASGRMVGNAENGYFDGSQPCAAMPREEVATVITRTHGNILKLIAGNIDLNYRS